MSHTDSTEDEQQQEPRRISHRDDLRIAAYIQRTELLELRRKRAEYIEYKNTQKNKMVSFLSSIFMQPIETPYLDENNNKIFINPMKFSVFEGISKDQIPTVDHIREIKAKQQTKANIFEQEKEEITANRKEHERLINSKL